MTQEEKTKRYDEALERAKKLQKTCDSQAVVGWCEYIFPELKESEEERIRKEFCKDIWTFIPGEKANKYIAWLEKQCNKTNPYSGLSFEYNGHIWGMCARDNGVDILLDKQLFKHLEKQDEQTHTELGQSEVTSDQELEPKFHPGDWITHNTANFVFKIINVGSNGYEVVNRENHKKTISYDNEGNYHLWTIADAKDGDVLASELTDSILLFRGIKDNKIDFYCDYDTGLESPYDRFGINDSSEHYGSVEESQDIHPATKEQRDTLIKAMANAEYTFDFDKKELKKVEIEKLNADKVIEWLRQNTCAACWDNPDEGISQHIEQFKKDLKL